MSEAAPKPIYRKDYTPPPFLVDRIDLTFDLGDRYARFLMEEILPEVNKKWPLTKDPEMRAICGASSGGICSFTVAWERPDAFRKVLSTIGAVVYNLTSRLVGGVEVAVVKSEGQYFAVRDECSHAQIQLSEGDVGECEIECWLHGSRFDLRTGDPTGPPAMEPVPVYPVEVRDGDVYVIPEPKNGVNT